MKAGFRNSLRGGFTLLELMVIIIIISSLLGIIMVSITEARENTRIKAETNNIEIFGLYLQLYLELTDDYPPGSDVCSICALGNGNIANARTLWNSVADDLVAKNILPSVDYEDEWGNPYGYDNNGYMPDGTPYGGAQYYTMFCSMGPNETLETFLPLDRTPWLETNQNPVALGDDICFFTP